MALWDVQLSLPMDLTSELDVEMSESNTLSRLTSREAILSIRLDLTKKVSMQEIVLI